MKKVRIEINEDDNSIIIDDVRLMLRPRMDMEKVLYEVLNAVFKADNIIFVKRSEEQVYGIEEW